MPPSLCYGAPGETGVPSADVLAEAVDGVGGIGAEAGEGGGEASVWGGSEPEGFGEGGGQVPGGFHGGEGGSRGETALDEFSLGAGGPEHRQHVVGGGEWQRERVTEEEGEVSGVHVRVAD